nr:hypothetical protein CFP56_40842 [Quercus suber]
MPLQHEHGWSWVSKRTRTLKNINTSSVSSKEILQHDPQLPSLPTQTATHFFAYFPNLFNRLISIYTYQWVQHDGFLLNFGLSFLLLERVNPLITI